MERFFEVDSPPFFTSRSAIPAVIFVAVAFLVALTNLRGTGGALAAQNLSESAKPKLAARGGIPLRS